MADPRLDNVFAAVDRVGETVTVRRLTGTNPQVATDCTTKAVVRGYSPDELVGGIQLGDKRVILSEKDLKASSWPVPIRPQDRIVIESKAVTVQSVEKRKIGDDVAMYVLQVR